MSDVFDPELEEEDVQVVPAQPSVSQEVMQFLKGQAPDRKFNSQALYEAQGRARDNSLYANLAEAGANAGYAIAGVKNPNPGAFDGLKKSAENPIDEFAQGRKLETDDAELEQKNRQLVSSYLARKAATDRLSAKDAEMASYHQGVLKNSAAKGETSASKALPKEFAALGNDLDPNKARTGEFGKMAGMVNAADRALVLGQQYADGNLPPAQVAELATSVASLVSQGGHAAESTIHRFVPESYSGSAAKLEQWLTSEPKGANQQAFVKQLLDTAEREKQLAQSKIETTQFSRIPKYEHLREADQPKFDSILRGYGVDPDKYNAYKSGGYKMPQAERKDVAASAPKISSKDQAAIDWAKSNLNDPRAKQILKLHGM